MLRGLSNVFKYLTGIIAISAVLVLLGVPANVGGSIGTLYMLGFAAFRNRESRHNSMTQLTPAQQAVIAKSMEDQRKGIYFYEAPRLETQVAHPRDVPGHVALSAVISRIRVINRRDILLLVLGFALGVAGVYLWPESYTYEQCIIDKMRGQPQNAGGVAVTLCSSYPSVAHK